MRKRTKTKTIVQTKCGSKLNKTQMAGYFSLKKLMKREAYWMNDFAMYDGMNSYFTTIIEKEADYEA